MKYAIVFERTPSGYSAYVPDLPGCVAAAGSHETVEKLIREAVVFHLEALRGDGDPIPEPRTSVGIGGDFGSGVGPAREGGTAESLIDFAGNQQAGRNTTCSG